jgi:hypothetical protein
VTKSCLNAQLEFILSEQFCWQKSQHQQSKLYLPWHHGSMITMIKLPWGSVIMLNIKAFLLANMPATAIKVVLALAHLLA